MEKFYHPELHIAICSSLTLHMPPHTHRDSHCSRKSPKIDIRKPEFMYHLLSVLVETSTFHLIENHLRPSYVKGICYVLRQKTKSSRVAIFKGL